MINAAADALRAIDGDRLVERAVGWCAINSGSRNLAGLAEQQAALADALSAFGGALEVLELPPAEEVASDGRVREAPTTAALRLSVRPSAPVQVALTGHYDTVYPAETGFRAVRRRGDGALNGPGLADMKGGLSVMLGALEAFEAHPSAPNLGWTVLISPDEETGSLSSRALLADLGARAHVHMTYEPAIGREGKLASARKGSGNFHLVVRGRSAHAGRDFAAGRGAVAAAARIAAALHELNGRRDGVTVNVARIEGGAPLNQVPDLAIVRFNVRLPGPEGVAWVEAEITRILETEPGDGIAVEMHGGVTRPPKPFNRAQQALFAAARDTASALGLPPLEWVSSGGVCEGNNLFAAGCPGIDTLGVRGGDIHSEDEHAWTESFAERARLSALLLVRMATGEIDARGLRAAMKAR